VPFTLSVGRWRCQFWVDCTINISERKFPTGTGRFLLRQNGNHDSSTQTATNPKATEAKRATVTNVHIPASSQSGEFIDVPGWLLDPSTREPSGAPSADCDLRTGTLLPRGSLCGSGAGRLSCQQTSIGVMRPRVYALPMRPLIPTIRCC
jgi:hypothetical protein